MDTAGYVVLTRQSGLLKEMRIIANNVANMSTTGFKAEELIFSEHIKSAGMANESVSMASANTRRVVTDQGTLKLTKGTYDFAIEGPGFFMIQGETNEQLTRSGHFFADATGQLVTHDGRSVLDAGGAPILLPLEAAKIGVGADGTISADGRPVAQLAVVTPIEPEGLRRVGNTRFEAPTGWEEAENSRVMQGYLEDSNVNPLIQMSRMIEVQRAYELGQSLMDKENERISSVIEKLAKR